jgi:integral membrane protein (TIGR01906 family)
MVRIRTQYPRLIQILLVLALPILLLAADLRIVTSYGFVRCEYGRADFPPDLFGLSAAERTRLAETCVDYLATNADISLLVDLQLPEGAPAFNERELRHMADVQVVYGRLMIAGIIAAAVLVAGTLVLLGSPVRLRAPAALLGGSLLTLGLLGGVGAYMALNWQGFFTTFHRLFFEGDSWIFPYTDALIRLFPVRFWIDVAAAVVGLLVLEAVVIGVVGWVWGRRIARGHLTDRSQL